MFHLAVILIALGQTSPVVAPAQAPQTPATPPQTAPVQTPAPVPAQAPATPQGPGSLTTAASTTVVAAPPAFVRPMVVAATTRLALTPRLDGKIDLEEWDPFATLDGVDTFFQWEPGKLHMALGHVPVGDDAIVSVDTRGDGWLVGKDNIEIRIHWNNGQPSVTERVLDNTPVSGPVWVDAANITATTAIAGSADDKGRTIEMTVTDPATGLFPTRPGQTIGLRFDMVPETVPPAEALMPRILMPIQLRFERGAAIPAGMSWNPEIPARTVVPGEHDKIRLTFKGNDDLGLKRVDMRTEGLAQNDTESSGVPFPGFDKKGRAFVDYRTSVAQDAALGYRVMRATVTDSKGAASVLQTSYEITPLVSFDFLEKRVSSSAEPQTVKFTAYLKSNTMRRVDGVFRVQAPEGWKVKSGSEKQFLIYESRAGKRQVFELVIPAGFKGTVPIKLIADFAGQHTEQAEYITVY